MSEEIKQLIDYLQKFVNDDRKEITKYGVEISQDNTKLLLNYIEQLQKEHNVLTEFEKWLEERINQLENEADEKVKIGFIKEVDFLTSQIIIFKKCLDKLQELKEGKK